MYDAPDLIKRLRSIREQGRDLRKTLISDLRAFQKPDDLSFFTLPISPREDISVASTCTGLMALVDCNELKKWTPPKKESPSGTGEIGSSDSASSSQQADAKKSPEPQSGVCPQESQPNSNPSEQQRPISTPSSPKELIMRVINTNWKSSGLRDLNAFTTCTVIRAVGFLVSAEALTSDEAKGAVHIRPGEPKTVGPGTQAGQEQGPIEKALGDIKEPTLLQIINAVGSKVPETFSISTYPPKATMAYWFVDGITRAQIDISEDSWEEISKWAVEQFDAQLRYVASSNEPLMDPASLAMSACLLRRLRRTFHSSPKLSHIIPQLPGRVELTHAIEEVFEQQTNSGIWHKYFPLFHFPKSGAADYTFSFELLEAILIEFSEYEILARPGILDRVENSLKWCIANRFEYRKKDEMFNGWNAGGDVANLAAGMPEAWATASVHMFLWQLESAISAWLQRLVLARYPRTERPAEDKWGDLIDVDINIAPKEPTTLKKVTKRELLDHAQKSTHQDGASRDPFLMPRSTAEEVLRRKPLEGRVSALLFGPPGTSKTSFAKAIAGQLGWPLIIITPSEFLSSGLEQIYVRASEIFDDLMDLSAVVILFDEMDALAQTRVNVALDVTRQLLTTSMLPKLTDLHDRGRAIFFMATNHRKDLDPAITRPGRFDLLLCVGTPNWQRKVDGLGLALKHLQVGDLATVRKQLTELSDAPAAQEQLDLFTVGDFRSFVESIRRRAEKETLQEALADMKRETFQKQVSEWAKNYTTLSRGEVRLPDGQMDALAEYEQDQEGSRIQ